MPTGEWVHLCGTYDGTTWTLYMNGESIASVDASVEVSFDPADSTLGSHPQFPAERSFDGRIDEVRFYTVGQRH